MTQSAGQVPHTYGPHDVACKVFHASTWTRTHKYSHMFLICSTCISLTHTQTCTYIMVFSYKGPVNQTHSAPTHGDHGTVCRPGSTLAMRGPPYGSHPPASGLMMSSQEARLLMRDTQRGWSSNAVLTPCPSSFPAPGTQGSICWLMPGSLFNVYYRTRRVESHVIFCFIVQTEADITHFDIFQDPICLCRFDLDWQYGKKSFL